ncbi:MAG: murein biosynthesis integral membrane protein MurJ [Clostridiales bacterium]|nr:murein biosynthesis integral membrane protein MurJ [Erysipelotrichaceae bacterium]MBQ4019208.1 murein biosynthesis integral membrane protein MurJ [Erysipelotrichaceae bacterium]MBQ6270210.1 murein biosynthesis integral membrane protein MurJ [Clostridiales bacterium]
MSNPIEQRRRQTQSKKTKSIAFSTIIMIIGLILSKGSGFLRTVIIGHKFSETYRDAFVAAFLIPDFVFALLVGGSIQSAITPTLSKAIEQKTQKKAWRGVSIFITWMSLFVLTFVVVCEVFSNYLYKAFNQGKSEDVVRLAGNMARTLYPQIFFMMLAALCIGVLNAYKKFGSTAFGPPIYNICVLLAIGLLGASNEESLYLTGVGVMAAAMIYFVFQLFMGRREMVHYRPSLDTKDPEFRRLFKLAIPILISASIVQVNMLLLNSFATRFGDGPLYALNSASTLWQLPYGIFAVGIGNVMLPSLASHFANKDYKESSKLLSTSIKNALFLTIPCAGIFLIMPLDIVKTLLQWSANFTDKNAEMAALFLTGYCAAIVIQSVIFILNQAFYAIGQTRFPLFAGIVSMIVNFGMCFLLVNLGCGAMCLTISYSVSCLVRMILLAYVYTTRHKKLAPRRMRAFLIKSVICLAALLLALYLISLVPFNQTGKVRQFAWLGARGLFAFAVYFGMAFALRMEELQIAYDRYIRRFFKKKSAPSK